MPTLRSIWRQMWERTSLFIRKAGTVILATSIIVWLLLAIPVRGEGRFGDTPVDQSAFAAVAKGATPVFAPLGFGRWETSGALVTGLIAKEVVVGTLAQVYSGVEEEVAPLDKPATLADDLTGIAGGFGAAVGDALRALPGIVGINLVEAEEEPVAEGLAVAVRTGVHGEQRRSWGAGSAGVFWCLYSCTRHVWRRWQPIGTSLARHGCWSACWGSSPLPGWRRSLCSRAG